MILVFSEIIPKTLGARYWQQLAICAYILRWVQWAMYPLVVGAKSLTGWISSDSEVKTTLSREDFFTLAKVGQQEGVIDGDEANAISALLALWGLVARDIMTPRTVIASLPADMCVGDISPSDPSIRFSRIPIFSDQDDDFIGFVRKDEIYKEVVQTALKRF